VVHAHSVAHPPHRGSRLVGVGCLVGVHVAQQLHHPTDLDPLRERDRAGVHAQQRAGVVVVEVDEAHLHRLLVVEAHVLQEPDVHVVAASLGARIGDQPADHRAEQRGGDHQGHHVDRVLPPRQHDDVVVRVVAIRASVGRSVVAAVSVGLVGGADRVVVGDERPGVGREGINGVEAVAGVALHDVQSASRRAGTALGAGRVTCRGVGYTGSVLAGELVGNWSWTVWLLIPLAAALAVLTAIVLGPGGEPPRSQAGAGGVSRYLERRAAGGTTDPS
jgi:hypothetical protein